MLIGLIKLIRFIRLTGLLKFIRPISSPELSRALQDSPRLRWFIRFIEYMGLIRFLKVYKAHKAYHYQAYRLIESLQAL